MRRTLTAALVAVSLTASSALLAPSANADDGDQIAPMPSRGVTAEKAPTPSQALDRAQAALQGKVAGAKRPEACIAMRDLFVALPRLTGEDRATAESILARPTNNSGPSIEPKYTTKSVKKCSKFVCVHRVKKGQHKATKKFARKTMKVMKAVWRKEVKKMGYRRPVKDGKRGGRGGKVDVYLADVGSQGLYGYCSPERTGPTNRRNASGYCVLDNDFARSQFGAKPVNSLKVTAAHEFFHAVQFAYDYADDPWLMEATATWMEERFADKVNDNRQYLGSSHLAAPYIPLDGFASGTSIQYGNWIFFEYLSKKYGVGIVKKIWNKLGGPKGRTYSINGVKKALPRKANLKKVYTGFVAANTTPRRAYPEGKFWPDPYFAGQFRFGKSGAVGGTIQIDHLSTAPFKLTPKKGLKKRKFGLKIVIDGPAKRTTPSVEIVWERKSGKLKKMTMKLNKKGNGKKRVPFNRKQTKRVYVTISNVSTRYNCGAGDATFSCRGIPKDDGKNFGVKFKVVR